MLKQYLIFGVFLSLTKKKKLTAREIAEKYEVSCRSVYRYIDALCMAGIPIVTIQGKNGGVMLPPDFKLDRFIFSDNERNIIKECLEKNSNDKNREQIDSLIRKI